MRILIVSQYFWPENFRVNDLCLELKDRGHKVVILTGKPNYPNGTFFEGYSFFNKGIEYWNDIKIYRASLFRRRKRGAINLFLNYVSFAFFSGFKIFSIKEKFDKIIVYQLSPGTVGWPGLIAKKRFKAPLYFYIQDLWPESLTDAGGVSSKYVLNMVNKMMIFFYNHSNQIFVQSIGFVDFLVNKGVDRTKIKYLPNTVETFYKPEKILEKYKSQFPLGLKILFAGNIGIAQDFDTIIEAADILSKKGLLVNWIIIGDGRAKQDLTNKINKLNLIDRFLFIGTRPSSEMPFYFSCADILLVSLKKSLVFSLTIPSKVQSYLACKKPIIGNIDGIGATTIVESDAGFCSNSGDAESLAKNVELFSKLSLNQRQIHAENGYKYFLQNFDRSIVYDKLEYYLNEQNV